MPRRVTLTDRQKDALLRLPVSQADLLGHYTLSDEDLGTSGNFGALTTGSASPCNCAPCLILAGAGSGRTEPDSGRIHWDVAQPTCDNLVDYAARDKTRHDCVREKRRRIAY